MDKNVIMKKIETITALLFIAIISMACICGGGSPQTNIPIPPSDTVKVDFTTDTLYAYGGSFTEGYNASPHTTNGYIYKLSDYFSCPLVNRAVSGSSSSAAWLALKNDKFLGINRQVTFMTGVNDFRATSAANFNLVIFKYIGFVKSAITLQFLKTATPATSTLVTKSSGWDSTTYSGSAFFPKFLFSTTANSTLTYTFTDSTLVIGTFGGTNGAFEVAIDGIKRGRYYFTNFSDGSNTQTLIYRGLTNVSHTVVVTKIGTTITEFDYFGHLKDASVCKPIVIGELPNWHPSDYTNAVGTNFFPLINTLICQARSEFYGYPVKVAPVNTYLNAITDIDTDNVHPTNAGHTQIFEAFKSVIK